MRFTRKQGPKDDDDIEDDDLDDQDDLDDDDEDDAPLQRSRRGGRAKSRSSVTASPSGDDIPLAGTAVGTTRGMTPLRRHSAKMLTISMTIAAVIILGIMYQLHNRGHWLPDMPGDFGAWQATEMDIGSDALAALGSPPHHERRYSNLFSERVDAYLIATSGFEAYTDPRSIMLNYGYGLTAEKRLNLFDKYGSVRAMILRNDSEGNRMLMYYWIQYPDGTTSTRGSVRNNMDVLPRFQLGFNAVADGKQSVIIRAFTQIHPADAQGLQARRNLNEVAMQIHDSLMRQTKGEKP